MVLRLTGLFYSPLPPFGADGGGDELNLESCSASTRIVYSHVLQTLG